MQGVPNRDEIRARRSAATETGQGNREGRGAADETIQGGTRGVGLGSVIHELRAGSRVASQRCPREKLTPRAGEGVI